MVKSMAARYPTSLPVVFFAPEKFQPEYAANISAGGMFLRTDRRLPVGALVSVALELPDGDRPAPVQGKVVHVVASAQVRSGLSGAGVGIQFIASDDPVRRRVDRYIELLAKTTPALERRKRADYPRLEAPVYWRPLGLRFFRRKEKSIGDLGGVRVYVNEKLTALPAQGEVDRGPGRRARLRQREAQGRGPAGDRGLPPRCHERRLQGRGGLGGKFARARPGPVRGGTQVHYARCRRSQAPVRRARAILRLNQPATRMIGDRLASEAREFQL